MPKPNTDNIAGHRLKYEMLAAQLPPQEVGEAYVGSTDPIMTGYYELELIRAHTSLDQAEVVDIGCGIGRLAKHLLHEPISSYLGLDIIPEIMASARTVTQHDRRFRFELAHDCKIPCDDESKTIVVGFSVITHLIDEEIFDYFTEAKRVLKRGGLAIFTFLDFDLPSHQDMFFRHAAQYKHSHGDMLKFSTKSQLEAFAERVGLDDVRFINAGADVPISFAPSALFDTRTHPPQFHPGQSVCAMRA